MNGILIGVKFDSAIGIVILSTLTVMVFAPWTYLVIRWWFGRVKHRVRDRNMSVAIDWGKTLSSEDGTVPPELVSLKARVEVLAAIEAVFPNGYLPSMPYVEQHALLKKVATVVMKHAKSMKGEDWEYSAGVGLRLWGGCMIAAKTIARGTRSGPNTRKMRAAMARHVEEEACRDPVVAAGVDAAPAFKTERRQPWSLDGVPWYSWLRQQNDNSSPHEDNRL